MEEQRPQNQKNYPHPPPTRFFKRTPPPLRSSPAATRGDRQIGTAVGAPHQVLRHPGQAPGLVHLDCCESEFPLRVLLLPRCHPGIVSAFRAGGGPSPPEP